MRGVQLGLLPINTRRTVQQDHDTRALCQLLRSKETQPPNQPLLPFAATTAISIRHNRFVTHRTTTPMGKAPHTMTAAATSRPTTRRRPKPRLGEDALNSSQPPLPPLDQTAPLPNATAAKPQAMVEPVAPKRRPLPTVQQGRQCRRSPLPLRTKLLLLLP